MAFSAPGYFSIPKNKVGARFWTIISVLGFGFGWFSHFSPYTDQNTKVIQGAYQSALAGWLALACLFALMLVLIVGAVYAGYQWMRETKQQR